MATRSQTPNRPTKRWLAFLSWQVVWSTLAIVSCFTSGELVAEDPTSRYFEQMRQRRLYGLAESEATSRLADEKLDLDTQIQMTVELSRTLAEHAGYVPDDQRSELWQRANEVVDRLEAMHPSHPRSMLLIQQSGAVWAERADWLRAEREVRLFDDKLSTDARSACDTAIAELSRLEAALHESSQTAATKKVSSGTPLSGFERKLLLHQTRWLMAMTYRNRAELSPSGTPSRIADLTEAEQIAKRLIEVSENPIQTQSRLLLVSCLRLKGDESKAQEMVKAIGKAIPEGFESLQDQLTAERVQLLMDQNEPTEAAEVLLKSRSERRRLSGMLWYLQVKVLSRLREIAIDKKEDALASRLAEQVETTIGRCEAQVGGYWARRCRRFWDNTATSQKYGEPLDASMQQARAAYSAGQIDISIDRYGSAERIAKQEGNAELAAQLAFTRASILLQQSRYETASVAFTHLVVDYPNSGQTPKADLLAAYCLGRIYDSEKTAERLTAYRSALEHHLSQFPQSETVNEIYFLQGQLEEQQTRPDLAIPQYLKIHPQHTRFADAIAATARCDEAILEQMMNRREDTHPFAKESTRRLSTFLDANGKSVDEWGSAEVDVALRLASISLTSAGQQVPQEQNDTQSRGTAAALTALCKQAEFRIGQVQAYTDRTDRNSPSEEIKKQIQRRLVPLLIMALASQGKIAEAERLLKPLELAVADQLSLLSRLVRIAGISSPENRLSTNVILLKVAEQLASRRDDLTPADQLQFDLTRLRIYQSTNERAKAAEIARQLMAKHGTNAEIQRTLALDFAKMNDTESWAMSKDCWRRVESLNKPGSDGWLQARLEVIKTCIELKQVEEAKKLLQVTKVLHPKLGGTERKAEFDSVEQRLQQRK